MRLIHTADWHLGQSLHGFDRRHEQQCFLNWLLETLVEKQVDALMIAGDIFDTANPSAQVQQQLYQFLTAARASLPHLNTILIAGNHDSPARLEAPRPFLQLLDAVVSGQVWRLPDGQHDLASLVVPLKDQTGTVAAWCLAVPFLRPTDVPKVVGEEDAFLAGVKQVYAQTLALAQAQASDQQAIIALGHCYLQGGAASQDSERRIMVGNSEALPANLFSSALTYVALGHLHLAQTVGQTDWIRYAGSPLPMSFAEAHYTHQVLCVELAGQQLKAVESLPIPRFVDLLRVPAKPAPLDKVLEALQALVLETLPEAEQPYLEVRVQLTAPEPGLRQRIEEALHDKPVRLAKIETSYLRTEADDKPLAPLSLDELAELDPLQLLTELYQQKYTAELPPELSQAFLQLLQETQLEAV